MALQSRSFPGCCTMKVLAGFGETYTADYDLRGTKSEEEIRAFLQREVRGPSKFGIAVVATNSEQKLANKILEEEGWSCSPWAKKTQHTETQVKLWYKLINE